MAHQPRTPDALGFPLPAGPGLAPLAAARAAALDRWAREELHVPTLLLMEHAGLAVARAARDMADGGAVWVLAGPGNNGGDGMVAARLLAPRSAVALLREPDPARSPDASLQLRILRAAGIPVASHPATLPGSPAVLVDALLGTGAARTIEGELAAWIRWTNDHPAPVVAVDLPSGLHADTGEPLGVCVRADVTVTFVRPKAGLLAPAGAAAAGRIEVASLGLPEPSVQAFLGEV